MEKEGQEQLSSSPELGAVHALHLPNHSTNSGFSFRSFDCIHCLLVFLYVSKLTGQLDRVQSDIICQVIKLIHSNNTLAASLQERPGPMLMKERHWWTRLPFEDLWILSSGYSRKCKQCQTQNSGNCGAVCLHAAGLPSQRPLFSGQLHRGFPALLLGLEWVTASLRYPSPCQSCNIAWKESEGVVSSIITIMPTISKRTKGPGLCTYDRNRYCLCKLTIATRLIVERDMSVNLALVYLLAENNAILQ